MKVTVAQLGARMGFAVPRILAESGNLEQFYTDGFVTASRPWQVAARLAARSPATLVQRSFGRASPTIPSDKIHSFGMFGLRYAAARRSAADDLSLSAVYERYGRSFALKVARYGFGQADTVWAFDTAAAEIFIAAGSRGLRTVLEQSIVPRLVMYELLRKECERWPTWCADGKAADAHLLLAKREMEEWALADIIVCGSQFVRDAVSICNGPVDRCVVVPYGVDLPQIDEVPACSRPPNAPLRVLSLGGLQLRKGTQYLLSALQRLGKDICAGRIVGPIAASQEVVSEAQRIAEVVGPITRREVVPELLAADVLVVPSIAEGSATVTYEALAAGVPVICTPNAGAVIEDGVDGFVVPVADSDAIADTLRRLSGDRHLLASLAAAARSRASSHSLRAYGERLLPCLRDPTASAAGVRGA